MNENLYLKLYVQYAYKSLISVQSKWDHIYFCKSIQFGNVGGASGEILIILKIH